MSDAMIPEDAPFSAEQRAWLNGFFAAWMGLETARGGDGEQLSAAAQALASNAQLSGEIPQPKAAVSRAARPQPAAVAADAAGGGDASAGGDQMAATLLAEESGEDYPWHDESLDISERMALAEERTPTHKLMAAMAQLDCGACGYMCDTYAIAIASREEKDLSLCSPGGRETARMLKKIVRSDLPASGASATPAQAEEPAAAEDAEPAAAPASIGRRNPLRARVTKIVNLNAIASDKHTVHVEIALSGGDLTYRVGDSLGVFPTNCPDLVEDILLTLRAHGTEHVVAPHGIEAQLRDALAHTSNLKDLTDETIQLVADATDEADEKQRVLDLLENDDLLDDTDVLDLLRMAPRGTVDIKAFSKSLRKLQPRLYSIASSPKAHPGEVHLTVAKVTYKVNKRLRKGVASTMFADRLKVGDKVLVYAHEAAGFTVPEDDAAPMIMVGPGTGIAPFRAFLEEREATSAEGKNWLFFGAQHEETDFLYRDDLHRMQEAGVLSRLSTAFSRDQEEKIYVQHRMIEEGAELFAWLEAGGYFFVCGDAKHMAGDVDRALHAIVAKHGSRSEQEAKEYIKELKESGRYVRDVY